MNMAVNKKLNISRISLVRESSIVYGTKANGPEDAIQAAMEWLGSYAQETVCVLCTDAKGHVLDCCVISIGATDWSMFSVKNVLQAALLCNATSLILMHNHPSGDPTPSTADYEATERLEAACKLLDLRLNDHIITCGNRYYSFYENGLFQKGE